jgi:rare lipoprotein A
MKIVIILIALLALTADVQAFHTEGMASWYGHESGNRTANGERWNPHGLTAASWYFPFNTVLRVICLKTGKCVTVRVNDRGPAKRLHRTLDVSQGAAQQLGILKIGVAKVKIEVVRYPTAE